jgi:hypothetical protein
MFQNSPSFKFFLTYRYTIYYGGQSNFELKYLGELSMEFKNISRCGSEAKMGLIDEKTKVEIRMLLSL